MAFWSCSAVGGEQQEVSAQWSDFGPVDAYIFSFNFSISRLDDPD